MVAVVGAAMLKGALKIAGPKAAKSAAGSILASKSGEGGDAFDKALLKITGKMNKSIEKMLTNVKKIVDVLAKASPALMQQLIILRKSIMVFLRPIGDILAKFVRPMAIWFLKIAVLWYKWLGGKFGIGGTGDAEDLKKQIVFNTEVDKGPGGPGSGGSTGPAGGATGGKTGSVDSTAPAQGFIASMLGAVNTVGQAILDGIFHPLETLKTVSTFLWDLIPDVLVQTGQLLKEVFANLGEVFVALWDVIGPSIEQLWEFVKIIGGAVLVAALFALNGVLVIVNAALKGVTTVLELLNVGIEWLHFLWEELYNFLSDSLTSSIKDLTTAFQSIWEKLKGFWSWITSIKLPSWWGKKEAKSSAVGGLVEQSGLYNLHAGERVLTAGQVAQGNVSGGKTININNTFNIPSTISSEFDIRELAAKLADYNERELRRRVSYI